MSTVVQDQPQLALFVRYANFDLILNEWLLDIIAFKESARGVDVEHALDTIPTNAEVSLNTLVSVATDGAHSMVGNKADLKGRVKNDNTSNIFCLFTA